MARPIITCSDCGEEKEHCAKGLCRPCWRRQWYLAHQEREVARGRLYYTEHREERRAYRHRHYEKNREELMAYARRYREENPDYDRSYYREHREEALAYQRQWQKDNPEKAVALQSRYRARKRALPDTLTSEEAKQLFRVGEATYPGQKLHLDHIVPISKGGGTTRANMHAIPATMNSRKGDKLPGKIYQQASLQR